MTEYDFSPAAQQAYQAKLAGIAQWSRNVPSRPDELTNPFVPTARDDTDFYKSKSKHSSSKHRHRRSGARHRSRGRGWDDSSSTGSSDDDDGGPDRPPTPPASAPVFAASPYGGWTSPWQQQQPVYGVGAGGVVSPPTTNVLVPTWNGSAWVYASPVGQQVPPQPVSAQSSSRHHRHRDRDRDRDHRERERPKYRRRDSRSVPPPVSPPLLGAASPSYPGACYVPVPNGGSFMVYQPQPHPQQQQQQHLQPVTHQGSSPASAWSAPLPGTTSPPAHLSPRHQPPTAAATGYFGITPAQVSGGYYGSPPVGVHVQVQSPAGSVYSYGHPTAWGSPAVSAGWGSAYASPLPSGGVPPGYGGAGAGGYYGPPPGQGVVIVEGARPRKGYEAGAVMPTSAGGKGMGSASLKSGKSGRSLWGRFVGGM